MSADSTPRCAVSSSRSQVHAWTGQRGGMPDLGTTVHQCPLASTGGGGDRLLTWLLASLCDDVRVTDEVLADQVDYYRCRAGEYDVTAYGDVAAARARIARLVAEMSRECPRCPCWPATSGTDVAHLMSRSQLARERGRGGVR
jgi:hypothetical protein